MKRVKNKMLISKKKSCQLNSDTPLHINKNKNISLAGIRRAEIYFYRVENKVDNNSTILLQYNIYIILYVMYAFFRTIKL